MRPKTKKQHEPYDWAQALLSVARANATDIGELAKAAKLDPVAGDLSDIDLSDLDLSGQNFAGWDLRHAKLSNAKLSQTELRGAALDVRELIQADDWENAELDLNVRSEATILKEARDHPPHNPVLLKSIHDLELSVRTDQCLSRYNINFVGDLIQITEVEALQIPNFGRNSLNEIKAVLAEIGLHLGMARPPGWPPDQIEVSAKKNEGWH